MLGALYQDTGRPVLSGALKHLTVTDHRVEPSDKNVRSLVCKEKAQEFCTGPSANGRTHSEAIPPGAYALCRHVPSLPLASLKIWKVYIKKNMAHNDIIQTTVVGKPPVPIESPPFPAQGHGDVTLAA